jgi:hypothetical protein
VGGVEPAACEGAVEGLVANGGSCASDDECTSGWCTADHPGDAPVCPGQCSAFKPLGAQCAAAEECGPNATCEGFACVASTAPGAANQPCGSDDSCQAGLYCETPDGGGAGTCRARKAAGAACTGLGVVGGECAIGLACAGAFGAGTCTAIATLDQPCSPAAQVSACALGLYCDAASSACKAQPTTGQACSATGPNTCVGSWCNGGTCAAYLPTGASCNLIDGSCGFFATCQTTGAGTTGTCQAFSAQVCTF